MNNQETNKYKKKQNLKYYQYLINDYVKEEINIYY